MTNARFYVVRTYDARGERVAVVDFGYHKPNRDNVAAAIARYAPAVSAVVVELDARMAETARFSY